MLVVGLSNDASAMEDAGGPDFVPNRLIVRFEPLPPGDPTAQRPQIPRQRQVRQIVRSRIDFSRVDGVHQVCVVDLTEGNDVRALAEQVSRLPGVRYAEPDYIVHADDIVPNDERFVEMWGLENDGTNGIQADADIDAAQAWDTTTGSSDVIVAIIDSGVDFLHPDLSANMWINHGESGDGRENDGIDNDDNGYVDDVYGYDFLRDDPDPSDSRGHGTHVAGTVAAVGNNGVGVTGVSWSSRIMALRFLSSTGSGPTSAAVEAIYYAIDNGAHIINNSWGGRAFSQTLEDAVADADEAGVLFVAAAGNAGDNIDETPHYPASHESDNVVSVASTTSEDLLAGFSGYGEESVDLAAPGVGILSTTPPFVEAFSEDMEGTELLTVPVSFEIEGDVGFWGAVESTFGDALAVRSDVQQSSPYTGGVSTYLVTPPMDTRGLRGLAVHFDYRYEIDPSDLFTVEVWDGTEWVILFSRSSRNSFFESFFTSSRDLEAYRHEAMRVRFGWNTDDVDNDAFGVELDNIEIRYVGDDYEASNAYGLSNGTSMSTPHVSGVAVLLLSEQSDMSMRELKERLMFGGDPVSSLSDITVSGRRLNAPGALDYVGPLRLISPTGGEQWGIGETYRIEWDCIGCPIFPVDVSVFQGIQQVLVLGEGFPSRGFLDWTIPIDFPIGESYRVFVEGYDQFALTNDPITVFRSIVYIDTNARGTGDGSTWENAYTDLNVALAEANEGQTLWVAEGVYLPTRITAPGDPRSATFSLRESVTLLGGFAGDEESPDERDPIANLTVLSGDIDGNDGVGDENRNDNVYHVVTADDVDASAVLDGFIVTAGNANGNFPDELGGGLIVKNGGNPTVRRCVFVDNFGNVGGGVGHRGGQSHLTDCDFVANQGNAEGGAIWNATGVTPTLLRCRFAGNSSQFGGAIGSQQFADTSIAGSIFVGNAADQSGGALRTNNISDQIISRCTFVENSAPRGALMALDTGLDESANMTISNSILSNKNNEKSTSPLSFFSTPPVVDWSCIGFESGQAEGIGTVRSDPGFIARAGSQWSADPVYNNERVMTVFANEQASWSPGELQGLFVNPDITQPRYWLVAGNDATTIKLWGDLRGIASAGSSYEIFDYHLILDSPCVNGGDPAFGIGDIDIDGDELTGCRVDMGADESLADQPGGDFTGDSRSSLLDYQFFQICLANNQAAVDWRDACLCAFDLDDSGDLTLADFSAWLVAVEADNP